MSVQRWMDGGSYGLLENSHGMWVRYADHVAAMIAEGGAAKNYGYQRGYAAALDAARDAVSRTCGHTKYEGCRPCTHDDALAAIDALRGAE